MAAAIVAAIFLHSNTDAFRSLDLNKSMTICLGCLFLSRFMFRSLEKLLAYVVMDIVNRNRCLASQS